MTPQPHAQTTAAPVQGLAINESKFFHLVKIGEQFAGPAYRGQFTVFEKVSKRSARVVSSPFQRSGNTIEHIAPMAFAWRIPAGNGGAK